MHTNVGDEAESDEFITSDESYSEKTPSSELDLYENNETLEREFRPIELSKI